MDSAAAWRPRMGVRCSRAAAPAGERSSLSAPKGSLHPWFSETCSSAAVEGFPKGLRRGDSLRRASVRGILRPRGATGGSAHRIYNATRAGQGGGAESNQTAGPRGRPPAPGPVEPTVLPRHQSTAQGVERSGGGVAPRSREAVSPLQRVVIGPLVFYQRFVSPALPSACRFHPTCSEYMREAVERYGAARGVWMGLRRVARCHPFHSGGFDPVR
jgi:hypothetical protein